MLNLTGPKTVTTAFPSSPTLRRFLFRQGFKTLTSTFNPSSLFFLFQMAKNRNKKKNAGIAPMDTGSEPVVNSNSPQAMDTSEVGASTLSSGSTHRKVRGVQMKRTKNMRKKKALAKAISRVEKTSEDVTKSESKKMRVKLAKTLYD